MTPPRRSRAELEAEIERLQDRVEFLEIFARLQTEKLIEALREARDRQVGRPHVDHSKLSPRRRRELKALARANGGWYPPLDDSPMHRGWIDQALATHNLLLEKKRRR